MTIPRRRWPPEPPVIGPAEPIALCPRGDFVDWLASTGGTLAVTTYNSGKLALLSAPGGRLAASFWRLPRPMGLAATAGGFAVATRDHVLLLEGTRRCGSSIGEFHESPRIVHSYATGRLDAHDLAVDRRGLLLANTRFNGVARPSDRVRFLRVWQPQFIADAAKLTRGDRCHLNGLGVRAGRLTTVTAFCESDARDAWRAGDRFTSGVLIDVRRGESIIRGLCMPHSPRWHAGHWWICNSGEGTLCLVDERREQCEPIAALPGFVRGLSFAHGRALVGLSRIRKRRILDAPPVRERFSRMRSGVWLVNLATGDSTGSLEFTRGGREVYDVAFLQGDAE